MSYGSGPDDKEISDDDDDRNHKHRRINNGRSQSLEDEDAEHIFTKAYRRGSKPFQNGYLCGETGSQSNETWKKYSFNSMEKEISVKFYQKGPGLTQFSRGPSDLKQKSRVNQPFSGYPGAVRGRGRDSSQWAPSEPGFSSVDIASQMVQSIPRSLFEGTDLATLSNSHGQSWSSFLVPGIPNRGIELFPLGLQGTYRPTIDSSLNMRLARQQCRDFEEQGFCLRGDMCPMEHGMNRIVIEDVQSLSQFNLPISPASANLSIAPVGTGPTPATSVVTNMLSNTKAKNIKHGIYDIDSAADFYDPDQPLWSNDTHASIRLKSISQPKVGKNYSLSDHGLSGDHRVGQSDGSDNELLTFSRAVVSPKKSSVHDRITSNKKTTEIGENVISIASSSNFLQNEMTSSGTHNPPHHQKLNNSDSPRKAHSGNGRINHKPSQKAERTLFVNGIPHQNKKRKLLLSHFKKFGEVTHISIPLNSERAFVQFSKREEAEAALMAPDAVMSNRFIKLWWANRDIKHDVQAVSGHNMSIPSHGLKVSLINSAPNKGNDDLQSILHNSKGSHTPVSASDHPKPVVVDETMQKKLESLELLKEEIRKKQEMLDQKRNDFRRNLDKLEKQTHFCPKGEVAPEQIAKNQKLEILADSVKAVTPSGSDHDAIVPLAQDDLAATSSKSVGPSGKQSSKTNLALALAESSSLKSSPLSLVNLGSPAVHNQFKLDNRPTAFKVVPPLPDGLADVAVLREHFSPYGDLSKVHIDEVNPNTPNVAAQIHFRTRHAAEKAFLGGKTWKGHNLQFVWLNSIDSSQDDVVRKTQSPFPKDSPKTISQQPYTSGDGDSEKPEGAETVKNDLAYETH
ncbi:hypothetical protein QVD17_09645 [Tagetes erecta]|uniref:Zinc finger CCCH domain-containing protein 41 n=1 Tax=Tagetes erecta TaxID=13708 RepID=A0AAD8L6C9_TARER|nr:hypothetical protein QVD17_09645 [Tagetes erecta]